MDSSHFQSITVYQNKYYLKSVSIYVLSNYVHLGSRIKLLQSQYSILKNIKLKNIYLMLQLLPIFFLNY